MQRSNGVPHQASDSNFSSAKPAKANGVGQPWPDLIRLPDTNAVEEWFQFDWLPDLVRHACEAVASYTGAPESLIGTSSLTALSFAAQGLVKVARDDRLISPCSLNAVVKAESGERKTAVDNLLLKALRDWARGRQEQQLPEIMAARANLKAWQAKMVGIQKGLEKAAATGKCTITLEADLRQLESEKPVVPPLADLFIQDFTPEGLAYSLYTGWPSQAILSAEAGLVVGGHGMSEASVVRTLAHLNTLWDGGSITIKRRTSESYILQDRPLTVGMMMQPHIFKRLALDNDGVARDIGFLARCLTCWPASTQGNRPYNNGAAQVVRGGELTPSIDGALAPYGERLADLMDMHQGSGVAPFDRKVLKLSNDAFEEWRAYHDMIEEHLKDLYTNVRDVASKSAEQAARIAACIHVFEHGANGEIDVETMNNAWHIAKWYLEEARRILTDIEIDQTTRDANSIVSWLRKQPTCSCSSRDLVTYGPCRRRERWAPALQKLAEHGYVRSETVGRSTVIMLHPGLRKPH